MDAVCVDLDGVLARYDGWTGKLEEIGEPLPGAREFLVHIRKKFRVVLHSVRLSVEYNREDLLDVACKRGWMYSLPVVAKRIVQEWLDRHGLIVDEIWIKQGKPLGRYYIDDRAIEATRNDVDYASILERVGAW